MAVTEKHRIALILLLIILSTVILLGYKINDPSVGGYQSYSTIYNLIARNYLRYGYLTTKFGWVINSDLVPPEKFIYYTRHPPLFGIILSLGILIFGEHEWSARLVPILFTIGNIILIFLITRELWGKSLGIIASFFATFTPINSVYGSHIDHVGSVVLFFMFATFFSYILWFKKNNNYYFFTMCLFFLLSALTAWPAYFLIPFVLIHNLLTKRLTLIWVLPLIGVLSLISFFSYVYLLTGNWLGCQIKEMFLYRMGFSKIHPQWTEIGYPLSAGPGLNFSFLEFSIKFLYRMIVLFSPILIILSSIWLAGLIKRKDIMDDLLLLVFILGCGSYCFVFPNITFQHEYVLICLWGPIAISSALGFNIVKNRLHKNHQRISFICIGILLLGQTSLVTYEKHSRRIANGLWEYTLGKTIREHVLPKEEVITSSKLSFAAKYYGDRFIRFEVRDLEDFSSIMNDPNRNYKYFIIKRNDPIRPELLRYLEGNYVRHSEGDFIFFSLK